MTSEIYYFSGTGNSLALAKDIAHKIDGKLISIPSVINYNKISTEADVIGIVFPSYYETLGGVPLIVRRFVKKLENIESKYLFAICTYGGASITSMKCLEKLINSQGGKIKAGFTVNMPSNMAGPNLNNTKKQEKLFAVWNKNLDYISEFVKTRKEGRFDTENVLFGRAYLLLKLIYSPLMFLFKP